ncbi:MAG: hypothetical protein H6739_10520 [Alphaproteobacteria bacterium]|nr:hypothetical protein [Alphaproteobacteria bacterium]
MAVLIAMTALALAQDNAAPPVETPDTHWYASVSGGRAVPAMNRTLIADGVSGRLELGRAMGPLRLGISWRTQAFNVLHYAQQAELLAPDDMHLPGDGQLSQPGFSVGLAPPLRRLYIEVRAGGGPAFWTSPMDAEYFQREVFEDTWGGAAKGPGLSAFGGWAGGGGALGLQVGPPGCAVALSVDAVATFAGGLFASVDPGLQFSAAW